MPLARPYIVPDFSVWEIKWALGENEPNETGIGDSHMNKATRATVIWRRLLQSGRHQWDWGDPAVYDSVSTGGAGWVARIWRPGIANGLENLSAATPEQFLDGCLRERLPHSLEILVDGIGVVLSLQCKGDEPKSSEMIQGEWETQIFNLPTYRSKHPNNTSALQSKRLGIALPG